MTTPGCGMDHVTVCAGWLDHLSLVVGVGPGLVHYHLQGVLTMDNNDDVQLYWQTL